MRRLDENPLLDLPCFLALAFLASLCTLAIACTGSGGSGAADILLITSDTTRQDDIGCYGGSARTPAIDALATDGVLLHNAFVVATGTTPSHASLLTASYAHEHRVYDNKTVLNESAVTLAEVLQLHGYATSAFVSVPWLGTGLRLNQGFEAFDEPLGSRVRRGRETADHLVRWLKAQGSRPFLAWIHFFDPHQPYNPPPRFAGHYPEPGDEAAALDFSTLIHARDLETWAPNTVARVSQKARALYRGEIEFVDAMIGRIVEHLRQAGRYDRTLIAFVADHGENFLEPEPSLAFDHVGTHANVTRLPLILKLPESRWAATEQDFLLGNHDIAPTLLDAVGVPLPEDWSGRSFLPVLEGQSREFRRHVVIEHAHGHELSVRTRRWVYREIREPWRNAPAIYAALNYSSDQPFQLYDLDADPAESEDIYGLPAVPGALVLDGLRSVIHSFQARPRGVGGQRLHSPELHEALRALGYAE